MMLGKVSLTLLALCLPALVQSLTCHRCFGYGFCNSPDHEGFSEGIRAATCSSSSYWSAFESDDPFTQVVAKALDANYKRTFLSPVTTQNTTLEYLCLTARIDEPLNNYTLRTCVTRAIPTEGTYPTVCDFIDSYIGSQNVHGGTFSCRQCNEDYCNSHALSAGDGTSGTDEDAEVGEDGGMDDIDDSYVPGADDDDSDEDSSAAHVGSVIIATLFATLPSLVL
uniref:Protein quiver n=1 Tax=Dendroctonus ponderosae TaxID=77166 RepID=A0AAR5Q0V1_DENPD